MVKSQEVKDKFAAYMRDYRKANPEVFRRGDLKKQFGITLEEYNEMLNAQNGNCAICKRPESKLDWRTQKVINLSVDHCHESGKIRGLLCADCNRALGMLQDSPEILSNAIEYLTKDGA